MSLNSEWCLHNACSLSMGPSSRNPQALLAGICWIGQMSCICSTADVVTLGFRMSTFVIADLIATAISKAEANVSFFCSHSNAF